MPNIDALPLPETKRLVTTGGHYAYLKMQKAVTNTVHTVLSRKYRGNYRSVPMERLIKEAQELADQGVKELILVAQETTVYGQDIYGEKSLHKLLKELCQIKGIRWIRLLYCYPEEIDDNLIQVMKEEPKICHYLDLPIQHASDRVLKRIGPPYHQAGAGGYYWQAAPGDPGYFPSYNLDQWFSWRDTGRPRRTDGVCG